jgi:UDP-N-acetylglucosamine diphosphorylase/glucosamine-1-phosphate N-acetyltransferase
MNICFFSDEFSSNFKPLTLTRPLDDLRIGIFTIREKWIKVLKPTSWIRQVENYLSILFPVGSVNDDQDYIWINSRVLPNPELINSIQNLEPNQSIVSRNTLIASRISYQETQSLIQSSSQPISKNAIKFESELLVFEYFWDLLAENAEQIKFDIKLLPASFQTVSKLEPSIVISNPDNVFVHESADVEPGCIFIAEEGPVYIGPNAKIEAGSIIKGPAAICEKSEIKMGARIFNGTTVGPVCKVGGEINNCIFHSYSNKAHDGFAGNSIIGQWSNFGAATNTSNLKNNYSTIKLPHWDTGSISENGVQFFGTVFGDFSKTAINTRLNTDTVCGVSSNIFSNGFPPKMIRSFAWLGEESMIYEFDKAIEAMRAMMSRRGVELTEDYIDMMRHIFNLEYATGS